ncbi:MAG: AAA family ATPase, partial [Clostridia bacterium]
MSNYIEVKTELINYLKARTPFVVIESSERNRVERMLEEIALEEKFDIDYYVDSKQVVKLGKQAVVIDASGNPLTYALGCIKKHNTANFVIGDARHLNSDNSFSRELLDLLYMGIERKATIIVITPDEVWPKLTVLGLITTLDYPNLEERCLQISQFIERYKGVFKIDWTNEDIYKVATLLRGLSEVQLDNILCAEIITLNHLKKENIAEIVAEKNKLFGHFSNVNQISLSKKTNVIGHDNLKEWLVEKKQMFYMPESVLEEYSLSRPKGVLLVGVPGCGKSYSAKMIAEKWDLPLFKFDLDTIYDKWVGESERKMRDALTYVDNIAPCVLWVD